MIEWERMSIERKVSLKNSFMKYRFYQSFYEIVTLYNTPGFLDLKIFLSSKLFALAMTHLMSRNMS